MPVYVITHPLAALAGLAAYARRPDDFGVETQRPALVVAIMQRAGAFRAGYRQNRAVAG